MKIILAADLFLSDVPEDLIGFLKERLSVPNPKWQENARMGRWNRGVPKTLRFYSNAAKGGLRIPRGYIRHLIHHCRKTKIPYDIIDKRRLLPPVDFEFNGRLKPFQETAVKAMLQKDFGVLCAPTGAGKTIMALNLMAARRQPALIVVHTKDLAYQWVDRISHFMGIDTQNVGLIGDGRKKIGEKITVALVQTLYRFAETASEHTGFLIVDESHRCPSRTFTEAVTAFDSHYMLGLSATPWRRDRLSKLIFWHLGDQHHSVDKTHLIEGGHMLKADIVFRETDFIPVADPVNEYTRMLSELTANKPRNIQIAEDVAEVADTEFGVCLVLSDRKAHCKNLGAILRYRHHMHAEILTGDVPAGERQIIIEKLFKGEVKILIATGQLIGEGFDCPNLTTIFLATPIRFSGRLLQYIGRVLRPAAGKKTAKIYDYVDARVDVLAAAANARKKVYDSQG